MVDENGREFATGAFRIEQRDGILRLEILRANVSKVEMARRE